MRSPSESTKIQSVPGISKNSATTVKSSCSAAATKLTLSLFRRTMMSRRVRTGTLVVVVLLTLVAPHQSVFVLPEGPAISSLGSNVTASCNGNPCPNPSMDEKSCSDEKVCTLSCPARSDFPAVEFPLTSAAWTRTSNLAGCEIGNTSQPVSRPIASNSSNGWLQVNSSSTPDGCFSNHNNAASTAGRFSLSMWISPNCNNNCTLVKLGLGATLQVLLSNNKLCIGPACGITVYTTWTHAVLQVNGQKASLVVNGSTVIPSGGLSITNAHVGTVVVGVPPGDIPTSGGYQLNDVRYYSDVLTTREIQQLFSGGSTLLPAAEMLTTCRCPPTHLSLKTGDGYTCVDDAGSETKRLRTTFNPPSVLLSSTNDQNWAGPDNGNFSLSVGLSDEYQVETIIVTFTSQPTPLRITVRLSDGTDQPFTCTGSVCTANLSLTNSQSIQPAQFSSRLMRTVQIMVTSAAPQNHVISSIAVDGRCNCNGNANSCSSNPAPYQCICNSNSFSEGRQCEVCKDGYFDNSGPAAGPTVCDLCRCDVSGINNNTCNKTTGQCSCITPAGGRDCGGCKDGYYKLANTAPSSCMQCNCVTVGSQTQTCDTTGQCPCYDAIYTDRICSPQIVSITPLFGPVAGGTLVTIQGQLLGNSSVQLSVSIGATQQNIIQRNQSMIVFKTPSVAATTSEPVNVRWLSTIQPISSQALNFSYYSDPQVDRQTLPTQISTFQSGGCSVQIKGSNMDSVAAPRLTITDSSSNQVEGLCYRIQADLVQCRTPMLANLSNTANLRFGLILDGVTNYTDLGAVKTSNDPVFNNIGSYDLPFPFERYLKLSGSGFTQGCSRDDIRIITGVVTCDIVSISDSEIECKPPQNLQGQSNLPITVMVGSNIEKQVGHLNFLNFWVTTYFIGIMCGIGGLIILIVIIIIICCCKKRKSMKPKKEAAISLPLKPPSSPTHNDYTELPQTGVENASYTPENGFNGTLIRPQSVVRQPKVLPPTEKEVDLLQELLHRVEPSLWDSIRSSVVTASDLHLGNICTQKGKYARIIDGQFSTTTAGQKMEKKVTIKTLIDPLPGEDLLPMWASSALRECLRLHRYSDENVLSIIGLALTKQRFHIIYPYMENRTLKDNIVDAKKEFNVRQLLEFGLQVAEGLTYLHSKDVIHRDLATRNCMVSATDVVKISDSAFSWDFYSEEYLYDSERQRYLPIRWMAPESLTDGYYDSHTDLWSFGVLLWELLTRGGCLPFHEVEDSKVKDFVLEGYMLGKPENCSDHLYEVMKSCWCPESEHRPSVDSVVNKLGEELTGAETNQEDIYVNLGTVEGYYENQEGLSRHKRQAPLPPR